MRPLAVFSILAALVVAPLQASAWGAIASNGDVSFTAVDYASEAEANDVALKGCAARGQHCELTLTSRNRGAFVVYEGDTGSAFAFSREPAQADAEARERCEKKRKNCRLVSAFWDSGANWFALALSEDSRGISYDYGTRENAEKDALARCESSASAKGTCRLVEGFQTTQRGYFAVASSPTLNRGQIVMRGDPKEADAAALKACSEMDGTPRDCEITQRVTNSGPMAPPASFKALEKKIAKANAAPKKAGARPVEVIRTTQAYSCETRCVNQACVSRFPDGKELKWIAPRVLEFGQWKIDTSGCGMR
jgi:hypothetical protein